jgi:hypothetical protein
MVEAAIRHVEYHVFGDGLPTLTVCCITMDNGFQCTGENACADPANFDRALGQDIAKRNAISKVYACLAFRLRDSQKDLVWVPMGANPG